MSKKKAKNKTGTSWKWWILGFVGWILLMILEGRPQLQYIRDTLAYRLISKALLSGIILYFTFFHKEKQSRWTKIILCAAAFIPFQTILLPSNRWLLISVLVVSIAGAVYLVYQHLVTGKHSQVLFYVTMFFLLMGLTSVEDYTFVNNSGGFHFWPVSLIASLIIGVGSSYLVFSGALKLKDDRNSEKVCICLLAFFMGFILTWSVATNLNYALDTSEPKGYSLEIVDKDISSSRSGTYYYLYVELGGEQLRLTVSQSDYFDCEIGDDHIVYLYSGAFDDPYYIAQ